MSNQNTLKADMATVSKALGEHKAGEGECVERWTANAETTGKLYNLTQNEMLGAVVLALRGEAREWAMKLLERNPDTEWTDMRRELEARFASQKETATVVSRFFTSPPASDYAAFTAMLKDADLMARRGCLSQEALMRQVIAKAPSELKGMLLQMAYQGGDWDALYRRAERDAWIAFPNNVAINCAQVEAISRYDRENDRGSKAKYCRLHGKCNHTTKECEIVKLVEAKGWKRNTKKMNCLENEEEENELS